MCRIIVHAYTRESVMCSPEPLLFIEETEAETYPDPWNAKMILDSLENSGIILYASINGDGKNVYCGYVIGSCIMTEAEVLRVTVKESLRGRGIGKMLMREFANAASEKGADTVYLELRESNIAAKKLYSSLGYTEYGMRKGYYSRPRENALLMSLKLQDNIRKDASDAGSRD